jgi:protein TonB
MQIKKYASADLERRKSTFFSIGLLLVLATIYCLFEFKFYEIENSELGKLHLDLIEAEVVPVSQQLPPPPPPPPQATTQIEIVANDEEIAEELVIEDLDIDENSQVEMVVSEYVEAIEEVVEEEIFTIVEKMPEFPGGIEALFSYLGKNIEYPDLAKDAKIEGKVYITFVVNSNGGIDNVMVLRGIGGGCDEEAVRVVKSMPTWIPGKQRGKAVKVQYNLPINFILK